MTTAISNAPTQIAQTDRSAAQCSDDMKGGPSTMTAVALLVSSFVIGLILFGPAGAMALTTMTLVGLLMVTAITDDDFYRSVNVHHTYHSRPYNPPAPTFSWYRDATPVTPRQTNSYIPTARAPAATAASGPHLSRGHVRTAAAPAARSLPQFEQARSGGHFSKGTRL